MLSPHSNQGNRGTENQILQPRLESQEILGHSQGYALGSMHWPFAGAAWADLG